MATIGLDMLHYAKITEDENGNESYGTPKKLAKAMSADLSVELAEATLYADDGAAEIVKEFKSGTLSLGVDDIGAEVASDLTGAVIDNNGVVISTGEDGADPVAIGFRAKKSNGKYKYFWLYRVKFGIPATALTVDVLPYHYKVNGDSILRVGRKGKFDNLAISTFVRDGALCLATSQELLAIPLSEITGYREYDEDFELDMWLKPEEPDSDKYKEFGIRKSGFLAHKGHGYFGLKIGEDYEVLIPCYDFEAVRALLEKHGVM